MTPYLPKALGSGAAHSPDLSAASLPAELRRLVDRVLKRSRLWPAERADVEAELAAHFTDGLAAGLSTEKLIEEFGDPDAAASLIRRAKVRLRPARWKAMHAIRRGVLACLAMTLLLFCFFSLRFYMGRPTITRNIRQEINAPLAAIPADQRAWPKYREALAAMVNPHREKETDGAGARLPPLEPYDSPEGAQANQKAIAKLREAAAMPRLGMMVDSRDDYLFISRQQARMLGQKDWETQDFGVVEDDPPAIHILLPHLGVFRGFARLLLQDVDVGVREKDAQRVSGDLVAAMQMAAHSRETPFLICDLVSMAIAEIAMGKVRQVLTETPSLLSDAALSRISASLRAMGPRTELVRFDAELMSFDDILQRSFTDNGHGDGRLTPAGVRLLSQLVSLSEREAGRPAAEVIAAPFSSSFGPGRKQLRETFAGSIARIEQWRQTPRWSRPAPPDLEIYRLSSVSITPSSFLALLLPALDNAVATTDQFDAVRDATLAIIALEQFRRAKGNFPASLDELVPSFLPCVPKDLADGQTLRYRPSAGSYILYSIGTNLKDDGGKPPATLPDDMTISNFRNRQLLDLGKIDWDWVFFPFRSYPKTSGER